jgi:hypothetical protein
MLGYLLVKFYPNRP